VLAAQVTSNNVGVTVEQSGENLFVLNSGNDTIAPFMVNTDGTLRALSSPVQSAVAGVSAMAVDPTGRFLYVTGATGIAQYQIVPETGLSQLGPNISDANSPGLIGVHPSGSYVYAMDAATSELVTYSVAANGALTRTSATSLLGFGDQPCGRASGLVFDPSGNYVYVECAKNANFFSFQIGANGALTSLEIAVFPQFNLNAMVIDPSGQYIYITDNSELNGTYYIPTLDLAGGSFAVTFNITGSQPATIAVDPNGKYVYVPNSDSTVSQFLASSGSLSLVGSTPVVDGNPVSFVIEPNDQYAYETGESTGTLTTFAIGSDGSLTQSGSSINLGGAPSVVLVAPWTL
jgi:DNA-binding beta-propeller fold protein YncE